MRSLSGFRANFQLDRSRAPTGAGATAQLNAAIDWTVAGVIVLIVAAYLGLVSLGQWQADEYNYFGRLAKTGWNAVYTRLEWSPRPFSEALFGCYGLLVNHLHRPVTGGFLGLLWAILLFCTLVTAATTRSRQRASSPDVLIGLALLAAFVTSGPLFQVFYWPAGAVAYLPTLSATALLFLQILYGRLSAPSGKRVCSLCLLVAALSSEMGAIFALSFCVWQALIVVFANEPAERNTAPERTLFWWALPGIVSIGILLWTIAHRLPQLEMPFTVESTTLHHPLAATGAAARRVALEVLGGEAVVHRWPGAVPKLMSKLTLAAGIALLWLREHRLDRCIRRQLLILTLSFLCAGFLALAVSYAHFGTPGGERYETLRRCWILMSFIAAAVVVLGSKGYSGMRQRLSKSSLGPVLILTGIAMSWHLTPLVRQYSVYGEVVDAVRQTFQSGLEPGSHQMTYITAPLAGVITPATIPPGIYMRTSPATDYDYAAYVLSYFNKDVLVVRSSDGTPSGAIASPAP